MPKGIRKGKSEEKIKTHIAIPEQYDYYVDRNCKDKNSKFYITRKQYSDFLKVFFQEVVDKLILENEKIKLPYHLGEIYITKYKQKLKKDGKTVYNHFPVDWNETLKLWEKDEEAKENKILVKHVNPNNHVYRFIYAKAKAKYKNKYAWWFRPIRNHKKKLKSCIKKGTVDYYQMN